MTTEQRYLTPAMEEQLYTRHTGLSLQSVEAATVIGTGGTGTWVAILLAMSGTKELYLMDEDYLEISNLNRLPYTVAEEGQRKAELLKQFITAMRPSTQVTTMERVTNLNLNLIKTTHIFDCTDRHTVQVMLSNYAAANDLKYIRVGYDGVHITVTDSVPEWSVGDDDSGYTTVASWVAPAVLAACMGVIKAMYNPGLEVAHFIDECFTQDSRGQERQSLKELSFAEIFEDKFGVAWGVWADASNAERRDTKCPRCNEDPYTHSEYLFCDGQGRA